MTRRKLGLNKQTVLHLGANYSSTFDEDDVELTNNSTTLREGDIALGLSDNVFGFEDGDTTINTSGWTDWAGDTGNLTAQTSTVYTGTYTGQLSVSGNSTVEITTTANGEPAPQQLSITIGSDGSGGQGEFVDDNMALRVRNGNGNDIIEVYFDAALDVSVIGSSSDNYQDEWSANSSPNEITLYNIDYQNQTFDYEIVTDRSTLTGEGLSLGRDTSYIGNINLLLQNAETSSGRNMFIDDVALPEPFSSGDSRIQIGDSPPEKIKSWDTIYYNDAPDGETVTMDVLSGYTIMRRLAEPFLRSGGNSFNDGISGDSDGIVWGLDSSDVYEFDVSSGISYTGNSININNNLGSGISGGVYVNGNYWISTNGDTTIQEYDTSWNLTGTTIDFSGEASNANALTTDGQYIYLVDYQKIYEYDPSTQSYTGNSVGITSHTQDNNIASAVYIDGLFYVFDQEFGIVFEYDFDSGYTGNALSVGLSVNDRISGFAGDGDKQFGFRDNGEILTLGGGFSEAMTDVSNGDVIDTISTDKEAAPRVNLSRADNTNSPSLSAVEVWWERENLL